MSAGKLGVIVTVIAVVVLGLMVVVMGVGYSNQEIELRKQSEAQQDANKVIFDKIWKIIQQKAQITDKYASDFKAIYSDIMSGRYEADSKDNPTFKWIHEQNPSFSVEMYKDLADSIEANRAEFARVQMRLRDIKREHDVLREKIPSCWFVGRRPALEIVLVTSSKTDNTFKTGEENDVNLFQK